MRILMISNHLGVQSGVQRYVQNLLLNLDTAKYHIDLFVGQCPADQASTAPVLEARGVHIIAVPDNKKDRIRALAAHLRTHKDYDIIHYHTASKIGAPVCGMMRLLCPRAKIVVHSHIVYPPPTASTSCLRIISSAAAWRQGDLCSATISTKNQTFPWPATPWMPGGSTRTPPRGLPRGPTTALPTPTAWPGLWGG